MNKKLLAAAITAALAAPMAAQADVTVYGKANLSYDSIDTNGTTKASIGDDRGDTRLGVRWSEDLGGGMKALGEFEFAPNTADAATAKQSCTVSSTIATDATCTVSEKSGVYARQTWVGLKGAFGQIEVGTVLQPYKYAGGVTYDAFVGTIAEARAGDGGMLKSHFGQGGYFANALAYRNHFGTVDFALAYSPEEASDANNLYSGAKGDLMASLKMGFSGGEVGVAYAKNNNASGTAGADGQANSKIFGKYSFGASTILAQYESSTSNGSSQEGAKVKTGSTTEFADVKVMFLGYQFKMGMNTLAVQLGKTSFDGNNQTDINYVALGGVHHFSKKTAVYLGYRTTKSDAYGTTAETDIKGYALGLVEAF